MPVARVGEHALSSECIQQGLLRQSWPAVQPVDIPYRSASVLMPLLILQGQWHLLYIRRSDIVQDHKGQVAFPGGAVEALDAGPADTALRETQEEIGIQPADVQVIGQMGPMLTITHFLVTPVVGIIPWPYMLKLQTDEVVRAFTIPLGWLADPNHFSIQQVDLRGRLTPVKIFDPFDGEKLWGITAQITVDFITLIRECISPK